MKKQKFSLIEILVVVAIIGILSSFLLPVLSQARETSRLAVCTNNLRQVSTAAMMYSEDYDDYLPSSQMIGGATDYDGEPKLFTPYLGMEASTESEAQTMMRNSQISWCPTAMSAKGELYRYNAGSFSTARAYYDDGRRAYDKRPPSVHDVVDTVTSPWIYDAPNFSTQYSFFPGYFRTNVEGPGSWHKLQAELVDGVWNGGPSNIGKANILHFDGHVQLHSTSSLIPKASDFQESFWRAWRE